MKAKKETWTTASLYGPNCGKGFGHMCQPAGKLKVHVQAVLPL